MKEQERFVVIADHDNYEVSNFGNVRNRKTGRILKPYMSKGYRRVSLNGKNIRVGHLVAEYFCIKREDTTEVDHIDKNRSNDVYTNLRWVTHSENNRNKKNNVAVVMLKKGEPMRVFDTLTDAAEYIKKELNPKGCIKTISNGISKCVNHHIPRIYRHCWMTEDEYFGWKKQYEGK